MRKLKRPKRDPAKASRLILAYEKELKLLLKEYQDQVLKALLYASGKKRDLAPPPPEAMPSSQTPSIRKVPAQINENLLYDSIPVIKENIRKKAAGKMAENVKAAYVKGETYANTQLIAAGMNIKTGISFNLPVARETLNHLERRQDVLFDGLTSDVAKSIHVEVSNGVIAGESVYQIADRFQGVFDGAYYKAERIARTETMTSLNQGSLDRYRETGFTHVKWLAAEDERTCVKPLTFNGVTYFGCEGLNGKVFEINNVPPIPYHPNCVLPDTLCEAPEIIAATCSKYRGPVIELIFAPGDSLTITPNHMILTDRGFCASDLLRNGDNVINCTRIQGEIPGNPNNNGGISRIDDIFKSFSMSGGVSSTTMPSTPENFHGDGRFCYGDINVVRSNSFLESAFESGNFNHVSTYGFYSGSTLERSLLGGCTFAEILMSAAHAADGGMSSIRESAPFFRRRLRHTEEHGFASPSGSNTHLNETGSDSGSCDIEMLRECINRHSGIIEPQKIIEVNISTYHGEVYDLQTNSSMYIGNSVLLSNCRCTTVPTVERKLSASPMAHIQLDQPRIAAEGDIWIPQREED